MQKNKQKNNSTRLDKEADMLGIDNTLELVFSRAELSLLC